VPLARRGAGVLDATGRSAFEAIDWLLFVSIGAIWGSSFLLIAIGLEAFEPGSSRVAPRPLRHRRVGLVPAARAPIARSDRARLIALSVLWVPFRSLSRSPSSRSPQV
jgi:hypothetical protein